MARFYQPSKAKLADSGIFQPNWELAQKSFLGKDQAIGEVMDTIDSLGAPEIDYNKAADSGYEKEVRERIEDNINDLTRGILEDVSNTPKNKRKLAGFKKQLEDSARDGDIYKLAANNAGIKDYIKKAEGLTSKSERDKYLGVLQGYYKNANGEGAKENPFSGPSVVGSDGMSASDFLGSDYFKALTSDEKGNSKVNDNGQKLIKVGNKMEVLTPERVAEAFKGFINDNPDALLRGQIGDEHFSDTEGKWLNENGKLDIFSNVQNTDKDGNSVAGTHMMIANNKLGKSLYQAIKSVPYSKTSHEETFQAWNKQYEENVKFRGWKNEQKFLDPGMYVANDATKFAKQDHYLKDAVLSYVAKAKLKIGESILNDIDKNDPHAAKKVRDRWNAVKDSFKDLESIYAFADKHNLNTMKGTAESLMMLTNNRVSYRPMELVGGFEKNQVDKFAKELNIRVKNYFDDNNLEMSLAKGYKMKVNSSGGIRSGTSTEIDYSRIFGDNFTKADAIGKIVYDPQTGRKGKIVDANFKDGTVIPNLHNMIKSNGVPISHNMATMDIEFTIIPFVKNDVSGDMVEPTSYVDSDLSKFSLSATIDMAKGVSPDIE